MSYQVLARKWRPKNFDELQGQEHVSRALVNAIESGRLHHAYLFTGTRGVGKTTIARILSKCLNCETNGLTSKPCGECASCVEIDEGRFVDLIEVDAASRTKVDDTRELLENVQYKPTRGRYKVYLIDEVHMLSNSSFNALLKTLEEPPEHVIFLLATTDPQKLPVTVLSRCLQFHLKHMEEQTIAKHLAFILQQESIEFEVPALDLIARSAEGSMRDALSLLDQAIAFGQGKVQEEDIRTMLGTIDHQFMVKLLEALANKDSASAIMAIDEMSHYPVDFADALKELLSRIHQVAIFQSTGVLLDQAAQYVEDFAGRIVSDDLQLYYQMGLHARRDLEWAPSPRQGLEMALLRMLAFRLEPSQVIQNSSSQTSLTSEAKKKASVSHAAPSADSSEIKATKEKGIAGQLQKIEPTAADKSRQKSEPADLESIPSKTTQSNQTSAKPTPIKSLPEPPTANLVSEPEEPPFNPDDYASFSDDERNEESIIEDYRSSPQPESLTPQSEVNSISEEKLSDNQQALASLHSALGLNFSDSTDTTQSAEQTFSQPKQHTAKETVSPKLESQSPQEQSDDNFKLKPYQPDTPELQQETEIKLESVEAVEKNQVSRQSMSEEIELNDDDNDPPATELALNWAQDVKAMDLTGSYQQIAQSSTFQWLSDDKIQLTVEPGQDILCTDTAKKAIESALCEFFNKSLSIDWQFAVPSEATPVIIWQRAAKAKHRKACMTITEHPFAQQLAQKFGARLDTNSIQYLDA